LSRAIAKLIEINLRATQTDHLALGQGRDLVAAFRAKLAGERRVKERSETSLHNRPVSSRDPQSSLIPTAYHDVPYDVPELVRAHLKRLALDVLPDP
jgi:hypothetical protein